MQPKLTPERSALGKWTMLARIRAYRRKKGPEGCRKAMMGPMRAELEMMIGGIGSPAEKAEQRDELLVLMDECRVCRLCKLGRE